MYNGFKVKIMIFAGRQKTMELLMPQLNSDYIDEILIGINTKNISDITYIKTLPEIYNKVKLIPVPQALIGHAGWQYLYKFMCDSDSIYFKLDDDIIYISENFFENILKFRFENLEYLCIFPMCVNNSFCATLHPNSMVNKTNKSLADKMKDHFYNGEYGLAEHKLFLSDPNSDEWKIGNVEFGKEKAIKCSDPFYFKKTNNGYCFLPRPQICAICFFGKMFKLLDMSNFVKLHNDEEILTHYIFNKTNKYKHVVTDCGLVCHYSFSRQKMIIDNSNIIEKYKKLLNLNKA